MDKMYSIKVKGIYTVKGHAVPVEYAAGWDAALDAVQAARAQPAGEAVAVGYRYRHRALKKGLLGYGNGYGEWVHVGGMPSRIGKWVDSAGYETEVELTYSAPPAPKQELDVDVVMEKAQEFASSWSMVGGPFDNGFMLEEAEARKAELRAMLTLTQPAGEAVADKANAGHPALQKLIDSIDIVDGRACWDYEEMYAVRDALNSAPPAQVPMFVRKRIERAISEAVNPKGMSVHDGMARVPACDLQMLLNASVNTPKQPAQVPDGWQLVPKEPTPRMLAKAYEIVDLAGKYRSMLAAAPHPKGGE